MINLRDYQQEAHDSSINHLRSKTAAQSPAVIKATVGAGKSILIAAIAKHVSDRNGRVLSLSRQGELCEQNAAAATAYGCNNSIYSASLGLKSTYYPVVFATEGTVARALSDPGFMQKFDLILIDEMQMVDYENEDSQFMRIIRHCQAINPKVRILGYSGSPYRGIQSVIGEFWKDTIGDISTELLTEKGFLAPLEFGFPDSHDDEIDFSGIDLKGDHNGNDYSEEQIDTILQGEVEKTFAICADIVKKTAEPGGVLIFGGSKLHCSQIKYGLELAGAKPEEIRIVTDDTPNKERQEARKASVEGRCKYFINIAVAAVGWDVPFWRYAVYMRPVGSLVFLIQSIGRVLRAYLSDEEKALFNDPSAAMEDRLAILASCQKPFSVVLDYAGVMDRLGHLYNNPMLEQAEYQRAKKEGKLIECPACMTQNSEHARRCIGPGSTWDGRCDHFWSFQECRKCGTKNDVTAQECRSPSCRAMLRDPAKALLGKSYTDAELTAVHKMEVIPTKNDGVLIKYIVADPHEQQGHPTEFYSLKSPAGKKIWQSKFLKEHIRDPQWRYRFGGYSNQAVVKNKAMLDVPTHIAYRINDSNRFVVGRKIFISGREEAAS